MTSKDKSEDLIRRIEQYFQENKLTGELVIDNFSKVLNIENYINKNISVMKGSIPFSMSFNACYNRMIILKSFVECNKKK